MVQGSHSVEASTLARGGMTALRSEPPFRVTHVLLDVDGTLVDSGGAAQAAEAALANHCSARANRAISPLDVARLREVVSNESGWRTATVPAVRHEVVRRLLAEHDRADEAAIQDALNVFTDARTRALTVFPDVCESLAVLRALGLVLIAASNGTVDLERFGLAEYFSGTHYAGDIGVAKPDPNFFALALQRFDIRACSTLAIGDRVDNDYEPARDAGLHSVLLDRSGAITDRSITRIATLAQVPGLVETGCAHRDGPWTFPG
ncbi:MAG: HAD family hydrolase [Chloroflexota bacterium]